jgi:hypothetical protein
MTRDTRTHDAALTRLLVVQAARSAYAWLPTAFFLFSARLGDEQALVLAGVYYVAEVLLELPSSYASDRLGRRATLVVAMVMLALGGFVVAGASGFAACVVGQVLVAGSSAFVSGTDTAFLHDHLRARGRLAELGAWESKSASVGFASAALACVVGGAASTLWLGAGYALSGAAGVVGTIAALGLADVRGAAERAGAGRGEWARFARNFTRPRLLWVFVFAVAMQVVNHVPLEFHQPYLEAAGVDFGGGERPTLAAGLVLGAMMLLGAFASRASPRFGERFGERRALLATFMLQCAIVWTMAAVVHPLVAVVIAARGVPHGLAQPLRNVMVHRELDGNLRATWFSLQSLVGSAVFSLTLFASAGVIASGTASLAAGELGRVLTGYGVGAALVLVCLAIPRLR